MGASSSASRRSVGSSSSWATDSRSLSSRSSMSFSCSSAARSYTALIASRTTDPGATSGAMGAPRSIATESCAAVSRGSATAMRTASPLVPRGSTRACFAKWMGTFAARSPGTLSGSMCARKGRSSWIASARSTSSSARTFIRTRISPRRAPACSPACSASASASRSGVSPAVSARISPSRRPHRNAGALATSEVRSRGSAGGARGRISVRVSSCMVGSRGTARRAPVIPSWAGRPAPARAAAPAGRPRAAGVGTSGCTSRRSTGVPSSGASCDGGAGAGFGRSQTGCSPGGEVSRSPGPPRPPFSSFEVSSTTPARSRA